MPKRSKTTRSRMLWTDLKILNDDNFEDAVRDLEADLRTRRKGLGLQGDAARQANEKALAHDLLIQLVYIRFAIGSGNAEAAALRAIQLGALIKVFEWNLCYGENVMRGAQVVQGARDGARQKAKAFEERDRLMAKKFFERSRTQTSKKSASQLMKEIGEPEGLSRSQSIAAINRGMDAEIQWLEDENRRLKAEIEVRKHFVRQGGKPDK